MRPVKVDDALRQYDLSLLVVALFFLYLNGVCLYVVQHVEGRVVGFVSARGVLAGASARGIGRRY